MVIHTRRSSSTAKPDRDDALLDATRERALIAAAHAGDRSATRVLVESHMRLVRSVARRITHRPCEDALAEGVVGLLEAIARFDSTRGARLATYAAHWIRARVQSFVLANRGIVGSPDTRAARRVFAQLTRARRALATRTGEASVEEIANEIGVAPSDVEGALVAISPRDVPTGSEREAGQFEPPCAAPSPEDLAGDRELAHARRRAVADALLLLAPRDRRVLERRALAEEPWTLDELAAELHLSRERVRQLEAHALGRIGDSFRERGLAA